ncbi:MAG TPA: protocadherin [Planctomycetaceae bacterium]|nr:protocadherin [Planctomycetaceae bacterium]
MVRQAFPIVLMSMLIACLPLDICWGRGFGGDDRTDGGGFRGGVGGDDRGVDERADLDRESGDREGGDDSEARDRNVSNYEAAGGSVDRSQLNSYHGLPSDSGTNHVNYTNRSNVYARPNDYNVNREAVKGPYGGYAAGGSVTGPNGNTAYRGAAVGPNGGTAATRGYDGANGVDSRQSAVVGPYGNAVAGTAVRGPNGGYAAGRAYSGRYGVGADYAAATPAGRYAAGAAVRSNFNHWGYYRTGWYGEHPGAWYARGWAADSAWRWATWDSVSSWMAYEDMTPIYYDYGNNITYDNNNVYMNGQQVATAIVYYNLAKELAMSGVNAQVSSDDQWMPLGVFALSPSDSQQSEITLQIAVNKAGIIRGNDTNDPTNQTHILQGAVDRKTQRAAFIEGTNYADVFDIGLSNLTKDEAPILMHFGPGKIETWQITRLKQPGNQQ